MTMKRTELEKRIGLKINNALKSGSIGTLRKDEALDRKAQRERDRALGLVPFAVKLPQDLVQQLHAQTQARGTGMNELVEELLRAALAR